MPEPPALSQPIEPMLARQANELPAEGESLYEPWVLPFECGRDAATQGATMAAGREGNPKAA